MASCALMHLYLQSTHLDYSTNSLNDVGKLASGPSLFDDIIESIGDGIDFKSY